MSKQKDAELILKLYELRRDPELRKARHWFVSQYDPKGPQDLAGLLLSGPKSSAYYRMVTSYWDMCGALVLNGGVDEAMFLSTSGEMLMIFAKLQPFIEETRKAIGRPEYLKHLETVALRFPNADEALEARRRLAAAWIKAGETEL